MRSYLYAGGALVLLALTMLTCGGCTYTRLNGKDAAGAEWKLTRVAFIQRHDIQAADLARGTVNAYKGQPDADVAGAVAGAAIGAVTP